MCVRSSSKRDRPIVDRGDHRAGHFAQIVRRNVGRHADADARGAVEQQHGQARRQELRLLERPVVVRREVDRVAVDFRQQQLGDRRQAALGVAHRRGVVAVARTEIALPVDQRVAQAEVLRLAHQRVVSGGVAVRVVLAQHVADHARRLDVPRGRVEPQFVHRVEDSPLHRFLAVRESGSARPITTLIAYSR